MQFKLKVIYYFSMYKMRGKFKSRNRLLRFQNKKLKRLFSVHLAEVPYFKRYAPLSPDNFAKIPLNDKDAMMSHFEQFNRAGFTKQQALQFAIDAEKHRDFAPELNGITVGLSTGTSGKQGIFLASERERAQWTAMMLVRVLHPNPFKKQKIAFFLRANSNLYSSVNSAIFQFKYFDIFRPIDALINELIEYQPDVLAAQPSILMEICKAVASGNLVIKPKSVISFAEVLHRSDRAIIESTFKTKIKEVYQCMEGFLGCTCEAGTMHLNEDLVYFEKEFIDETRFYPIITDFSRSTQYMVRYRLNDILKLKVGGCSCGSAATALELIEGRNDDVLLFKNSGGNIVKLFPDVLSRRLAFECFDFETYQVLQSSFTTIEFAVIGAKAEMVQVWQAFKSVFIKWMGENDVDAASVDFRIKERIEYEPGSKFRKIRRQFAQEF